jgi:hypothetical protein
MEGKAMRAWVRLGIATFFFARLVPCQPQRDISPVSPKSQYLFDSMRQGQTSRIRAAIEEGVDLNSWDANGNTLLMQAALNTRLADLEFLLAHGGSWISSREPWE